MLVETHLYSASEYIIKHNQGFVPTHEVTNILPWIHIPVLIYNQRTFNSIKILRKLIETHFYSASEYLYTMYILEASEYLYTKFYISIYYIYIFFTIKFFKVLPSKKIHFYVNVIHNKFGGILLIFRGCSTESKFNIST